MTSSGGKEKAEFLSVSMCVCVCMRARARARACVCGGGEIWASRESFKNYFFNQTL